MIVTIGIVALFAGSSAPAVDPGELHRSTIPVGAPAEGVDDRKPNLIVILTDDQGYGDLTYMADFAKDIAANSRPAAFVEDPKPLSKE